MSDNATPGDVFSTILDADTARELGQAWGGTSPIRLGFPDHTRIILLEAALGRLLAIEARHEGDGQPHRIPTAEELAAVYALTAPPKPPTMPASAFSIGYHAGMEYAARRLRAAIDAEAPTEPRARTAAALLAMAAEEDIA